MLIIPIKKKWFDMILSGEKKEEYRNHNDYYFSRFANLFQFIEYNNELIPFWEGDVKEKIDNKKIIFRNGYSSSSPSFVAECNIELGQGKEEWGAEPGTTYYILKIIKILEVQNAQAT